jgi:hypothetical protein
VVDQIEIFDPRKLLHLGELHDRAAGRCGFGNGGRSARARGSDLGGEWSESESEGWQAVEGLGRSVHSLRDGFRAVTSIEFGH